MESRHVMWDFREAIPVKREILHSELNFINILNNLRNYRVIRKQILEVENQMKTNLSFIRTKMNQLESTFPRDEKKYKRINQPIKVKREVEIPKEIKVKQPRRTLDQELAEIKEKLARLE